MILSHVVTTQTVKTLSTSLFSNTNLTNLTNWAARFAGCRVTEMVSDARWKDCIQKPRSLLQCIREIREILEVSSVASAERVFEKPSPNLRKFRTFRSCNYELVVRTTKK